MLGLVMDGTVCVQKRSRGHEVPFKLTLFAPLMLLKPLGAALMRQFREARSTIHTHTHTQRRRYQYIHLPLTVTLSTLQGNGSAGTLSAGHVTNESQKTL